MTVEAVLSEDQLDDRPRPAECLRDCLPTFGEETPGNLTVLATQQAPSRPQRPLRGCRKLLRPL
jgi:hypothetical protein